MRGLIAARQARSLAAQHRLAASARPVRLSRWVDGSQPQAPRRVSFRVINARTAPPKEVAAWLVKEMGTVVVGTHAVDARVRQGEMASVRSLSWATKRATKNLNTCANGGEEGRHIYFCDVEDGEASDIMSALRALGDVKEEVDGVLIDENAQAVMIDADMRAFLAMEQFEGVVIPIVGGTLPLRVVEMCCASVFGDCSSALARCVKRKLLLARLEACREVVSAAVPEKAAAAEKAESKKAAAAEKAAAKKAAAADKPPRRRPPPPRRRPPSSARTRRARRQSRRGSGA